MKMAFHIITYGCQMNVYDSRLIAELLKREGYEETNSLDKADCIIVNTCSVREHAERRALGRISSLQRFRKNNPELLIGVVGCMAQNLGKSIPDVDFVVGPSNYKKLPEIISLVRTSEEVVETNMNNECYSTIFAEPMNKVSTFVSIMRGCSHFCTYCIVPYVRGKARSRPHKDILRQIKWLENKGISEITLLGQSVNEYNDGMVDFPGLLQKIDKETEIPRIRFISSHPKYMNNKVINIISESKKLCKSIHLPLQSGSTRILKKMNRGYDIDYYMDCIDNIKQNIQNISLTTDIIVGFPGETDKDFENTLNVIKNVEFDFAFMFKYSPREGTEAYGFENQVPEEIKGKRLRTLIDIQNRITRKKAESLIGKEVEVLVEGRDKRRDMCAGRTDSNRVVIFDGKSTPGDFVRVKINSISGWTPVGVSSKQEINAK